MLINKNRGVERIYQEVIIKEYLKAEERTKRSLELDAYGRYQGFCTDYPDLCERIKQKYIASYIGISPVSLSRLKSKS